MFTADAVIAQLSTAKARTAPKPMRSWVWVLFIVALFLFVVLLFYSIMFSIAWVYGDWLFFDLAPTMISVVEGIVILLAGISIIALIATRKQKGQERAANALLAALALPEENTLPILRGAPEAQPEPTEHRKRIGPLPKLKFAPEVLQWWRVAGIFGVLAATFYEEVALHVGDILHGNAQTLDQSMAAYQQTEVLIMVAFPVSLLGLATYLMSLLAFKDQRLWADADGLLWLRFTRWQRLRWQDISMVGAFTHSRNSEDAITFVLTSDDVLIMWSMPPHPGYQQHAASTHVLNLVLAQTGLPLRDLTPLASALAQQVVPQKQRPSSEQATPLEERAAALLAEVTQKSPSLIKQVPAVMLLFAVLLSGFVAPMGVGEIIHTTYQPEYLATIPALLAQRQPMLSDALRYPDGHWPVHVPTQTDYRRFAYTNGGYTISGSTKGDVVFALLPDVYHAVAVQVTVTERGSIPPGTYDGVGIVLRDTSARDDNPCAFAVNYAGDWADTCAFESGDGNGHSAVINRGPDATNTLLVLLRGQMSIFYVNSHYVGQFFESSSDPFGQIGLVNEESGMQATFTDFKVWQINPPPSLTYV